MEWPLNDDDDVVTVPVDCTRCAYAISVPREIVKIVYKKKCAPLNGHTSLNRSAALSARRRRTMLSISRLAAVPGGALQQYLAVIFAQSPIFLIKVVWHIV